MSIYLKWQRMKRGGVIVLLILINCCFFHARAQQKPSPVDLVFPQPDTENSRWIFFSSACRVFNHIGHPWLTQYWSRQVVDKAFSALSTDRGFNVDEDQGLMGSLAVLMKIGLFDWKWEQNPIRNGEVHHLCTIRRNKTNLIECYENCIDYSFCCFSEIKYFFGRI